MGYRNSHRIAQASLELMQPVSLWQAAVDELQGSALLLCTKSRALHALIGLTSRRIILQSGTWTAVLDLAGEAYQAFFDSQAAALEALNAAGVGSKPMPLQQAAHVSTAPFHAFSQPFQDCLDAALLCLHFMPCRPATWCDAGRLVFRKSGRLTSAVQCAGRCCSCRGCPLCWPPPGPRAEYWAAQWAAERGSAGCSAHGSAAPAACHK